MNEPQIDSYRFGHLVVDGQVHQKDLIILPGRVMGGWWRKEGHALHPGDLEAVFNASPDLLVVGQGASALMEVTPETARELEAAGIELVAQDTEKACQTYNRLREQRSVAAALHLTC